MGGSRSRRSPDRGGPVRGSVRGQPAASDAADDRLSAAVAGVLAGAGIVPGATLCCALSGGLDSVVLLHRLAALQARFGYRLIAAHVHHGLSPNADAWLAFCQQRCEALGVPFHPARVTVARDDPDGLEAAARKARHAALFRLPCDWLVFGHHQDDQAETLLFRLLRGTGVRGAAAMAAVEPGSPGRLRPLLSVRRAELAAWAGTHGLTWIEDESNADPRFTRNALRHHVRPVIESVFPAAVPALARAAENFREASELLDALAAIDEAACGGARLDLHGLLGLTDERVRNLLRWQARRLGADAPARVRLAEAVRQLREAGRERPLRLSLGALACCSYRGRVWLEAAEAAGGEPRPWCGESVLPWGDGCVHFHVVRGLGLSAAALARAQAVWLRGRWPGLAMQLHWRRPRRSFKNLCQEAGIPPWLRERLPVLAADGEAVWVAELGIAPAFACGPDEEGVVPRWEPLAKGPGR